MANPGIQEETLRQSLDAVAAYGSVVQAAKNLGIPRTTLQSRVKEAERLGIRPTADFETEPLPSELPPVTEIVARRKKQFGQLHEAKIARRLVNVSIKLDGPIGITHFGDPHVDDDGTDIAQLERHMKVVNKTKGMFGANLGDLGNNWIGRIAHLWAQQSTSAAEAWALVEWHVNYVNWLYLVGGNHDCLDPQSEALTKRGWLHYQDIGPDDEVLSFDRETGQAVWSPIITKIVRPNTDEMVAISSRTIDLCVTPNHRILNRARSTSKGWSDWQYTHANKLPPRFSLPVSGNTPTGSCGLTDDEISIAGWLLTDGSIEWNGNSPRVKFYQSKPSPDLDALLDRLGLEYRLSIRERQISAVCGRQLVKEPLPQREYVLNAESSRRVLSIIPRKKKLPDWAFSVDDRQFGVLLDSLIAGDGTWDGADPASKTVGVLHGEKTLLDSVQAAAVCHGWRAFISIARGKDYRLNLCKETEWQGERSAVVSSAEPAPIVWCLRVPLGNFMMRRNGKAHFTGNCWSGNGDPLQWIMRQQPGVFGYNGTRLNLVFPNGKNVRINARHDFSGHSMWNPNHGPMKAAQGGWRDHILTCGHKHVSFVTGPMKDPASGLLSWAIRCAGYKTHDRYADEKGLPDQNAFAACVTVIDPRYADDDPRLITVIPDVEEGADFLNFKRRKK